ncbi:MAG: extracellular solute-binding protein [Erysipelotrichaceae bacterium]
MFKKLLVSLLALLLIAGCSDGSANTGDTEEIVTEITEPVEITFWHAMNGAQEEALVKLTEEFMAANENITITLQNQSSYKDLSQKLTATMASPDNLPTITQGYTNWFYDAAVDGLLQDISAYISNETIGIADADDIIAGFMEGAKIEGVQYGLPFNKSSEALFYNADQLEEYGVAAPTTFEEFIEAAKTVYEKSNGTVVGAGFDSLNNFYVTQMINRGHKLDETLDVTSEDSIEVINLYLDGVKEGYLRIAGSDKYLSGPFGNELISMNVGSTAGESYVKSGAEGKFTPGAVAVPVDQGIQQGTDIYMFANATAEQKTAAFLFMSHLTSAESQLYWAEKTGYLPVRTSVIESDEYTNLDSMIAPIAAEITEQMFTIPANANAVYNEIATMMEEILSQPEADLTAILETYKANMEALWAGE